MRILSIAVLFLLSSCSISSFKNKITQADKTEPPQNNFEKIDKNNDNYISEEELNSYNQKLGDGVGDSIIAFSYILGVILLILSCSGTFYGIKKYVDRKKENNKKNKN